VRSACTSAQSTQNSFFRSAMRSHHFVSSHLLAWPGVPSYLDCRAIWIARSRRAVTTLANAMRSAEGSMSNASRNAQRAAGMKADLDRKADSDTSGERLAMPHSGYAGLSSLGSEAFSAPLPPAQSEPPRVSPRMRIGLYVLGAAVGISAGAIGVAIVLTSSPTPVREPREPAAAIQAQAEVDRAPAIAATKPVETALAQAPKVEAPAAEPSTPAPSEAAPIAHVEDSAPATASSTPAPTEAKSSRSRSDSASRARRHQDDMPAHLSREQVVAAMTRVQPAVGACFAGTHGSAMASITVLGRTGRVTTAQVSGPVGVIGSCIARAVRGASFPRFADESLTVRYPFAH
jgi:hypothetical protein